MSWRCAARRAERTGPAARSPPLPPLLLLLWTAALAPGAAAGDEAAPAGASVCYASPPSVGSVQELVERAAVVIEGKLHPPRRRQQGALDREAAAAAAAGEAGAWGGERPPPANGTVPAWPTGPAPSAAEPGAEAPYLVKVHQVWAAKAGGLKKDSLLTVRLGAWGRPAFRSCGRLKEDSRYIFFMEPEANSSGRAPAAFRASFPPLETGRNLKKEVSRVLCKRCESSYGKAMVKLLDNLKETMEMIKALISSTYFLLEELLVILCSQGTSLVILFRVDTMSLKDENQRRELQVEMMRKKPESKENRTKDKRFVDIVDSVKAQSPAKCCSVLNNFLKCGRTSVLVDHRALSVSSLNSVSNGSDELFEFEKDEKIEIRGLAGLLLLLLLLQLLLLLLLLQLLLLLLLLQLLLLLLQLLLLLLLLQLLLLLLQLLLLLLLLQLLLLLLLLQLLLLLLGRFSRVQCCVTP
ncbi:hypothetical protein MJG53_018948 [Ovis ammon polii x Ovis aries]|uniref:Uncharacterized protein n=1 Tax=Ovis ammon polii x Ovis aries TaxID=2918886 RepID=A0ACB9U3R9_9CETA|nr:hypothetical protein MJG53_018948 [Ovis ammon polii x Ovis aries]